MATLYNHGSHCENHRRAAELHETGAHAHRAAANSNGEDDHQAGHRARQALECSLEAHEHTEKAFRDGLSELRIALFGHEDVAVVAHRLWRDRGCPLGSPGEDWFQAAQELRTRSGAPRN